MIELELMVNDLQKLYMKEKSLRNRVLLEKAIIHLKEYERGPIPQESLIANR